MRRKSIAAFLILLAATPTAVRAGQVRVDVGPNNTTTFSPQSITANQGDQVVFVWRSGSHSVTQGTGCSTAGAIFNSAEHTSWTFSWKADRTGTLPYFCIPHCGSGMTGSITISAAPVAVADFRITEVSRSNEHTNDYVEVTNLGTAAGNLGRYRLAVLGNTSAVVQSFDVIVPAGGSVLIHTGTPGTDTQTELYVENVTLAGVGSVALMAPSQTSNATVSLFLDYVEWGAAGTPNELTATSAGFWTLGQFLPAIASGHALEFCGVSGEHGIGFWRDTETPSPGTHVNCGVPVEATTWGEIKTLYR